MLKVDEIRSLCLTKLDLPFRAAVSMALATLARASSLECIRSSDLVWEEDSCTLFIPRSKTRPEGISYTIRRDGVGSLLDVIKAWAWRYKGEGTISDQLKPKGGLKGMFLEVTEKSFGSRVGFHSIRKAVAAHALLNGVPPVVIRAWGDWRTEEAFSAYVADAVRQYQGMSSQGLK